MDFCLSQTAPLVASEHCTQRRNAHTRTYTHNRLREFKEEGKFQSRTSVIFSVEKMDEDLLCITILNIINSVKKSLKFL